MKGLKTFALVSGVLLLIIGGLGLIPAMSPLSVPSDPGRWLLHLFEVNRTLSFIHVATAVLALLVFLGKSDRQRAVSIWVLTAVYLVIAAWGLPALVYGSYSSALFGAIHINLATELLHVFIAAGGVWTSISGFKAIRQPEMI